MTFLNELLLLGLAASAIPLVIHLLHRSQPRVVRWGAMHLLRDSIQKNARRFRIEQLLLVLIRCAIVACLALLLARPVITHVMGLGALTGGSVAREIVLDVSYSMGSGNTWREAQERCREMIDRLSHGDTLRVTLATGKPLPLGKGAYSGDERDELLALLESLQPRYAPSDLVAAIEDASARLRKEALVRRELVVVSDFQALSWPDGSEVAFEPGDDQTNPVRVLCVQVGEEVGDISNWSIESMRPAIDVPIAGDPVEIVVTLRRSGPPTTSRFPLRLTINDAETVEQTVLPSDDPVAEVRFRRVFSSPGDYRLDAEIEADALPGDNRFHAVLSVHDALPVLVLDGYPERVSAGSTAGYVQLALAPFRDDGGQRGNVFVPRVVGATEGELNNLAFDSFDVIVMADVASLGNKTVKRLERFVQAGGGLIVFGGADVQPRFYNAHLHRQGLGLLPAMILAGVARPKEDAAGVVLNVTDHPALRSLAAFSDDLSSVAVHAWHRTRPNTKVAPSRRPRVLASLTTGDPLLIEKKYGEGTVVLFATSCDDAWSNIPVRPWFLPFLHELVLSLVRTRDRALNIRCGDAIVQPALHRAVGASVALRLAEGSEVVLAVVEREVPTIEHAGTWYPGFYVVFSRPEDEDTYAANTDRAESNLERVDSSELEKLSSADHVGLVHSGGDLENVLRERPLGTEIWKPLLALLVTLLLLEIIVQQRIGGVRR